MIALVAIFTSHSPHELRVIESLLTSTCILAEQVGCQKSFVIYDPVWRTLLLLILWQSDATCLLAKPILHALLNGISGYQSRQTPQSFCFTLVDEAVAPLRHRRSKETLEAK